MHRVKVSDVGQKGDGVAHLDDGRTVFIDRALPGELLDIKLFKTKDGALRGTIAEVVAPSPQRAQAPCPHYDTCGGCQMQHMAQDAYRAWKHDKVESILSQHIDEFDLPDFSPDISIPAGTRRRVTFACVKTNNKIVMGYHKRRSKHISDIHECLIVDPVLMRVREQIKPYLMEIVKDNRVIDVFLQVLDGGIDCVITGPVGKDKKGVPDFSVQEACGRMLHETDIARISWRMRERAEPELLLEAHPLFKRAGALQVPVPPLAFLQPSREGEEALAQAVMNAVPEGAKRAADLFAGHGTFTGYMRDKKLQVDAFENDKRAVAALRRAGHAQAKEWDLFKYPLDGKELSGYDVIVLDPPRAGARDQAECIARSQVPCVIYVSCNPSTFARDAGRLIEGGYDLKTIQIVDQFIWSTHAEVIGVFERRVPVA
ncbi:MAG: RNA methyltransferase [Alphaproteobacteria bacterium]|nr:RNA methyltransferase [Alphaproteobacteria bacterium]|tara:strand:- start:14283 stop:15569 length:1287 start_codon:yes stop_codon:yes gene_type:complete